ncbi:MAG TPA: ribosome biogenesis GTPase Der [Marinilabiliales bacterium]|jgi:GTP-binding protein|nr:MAG: ribosome biogenesis GTPase Der [Bacteroidetes bacterium GWA2_40_14]OFX58637.1 MAG: ribosome biogenesis GTPase Der [Bacteroidetes bacterium GWC2_40_13]OFX75421.1 MAG: ribosome biogenesis GTPase Der [Bacteroidetes bacterium GWD2_40_43]OFX91959.1 MAG: ribosome biogenesis GTPase Der [Bacteroidetes bacterium GWE2_40_63]OFY24624.1 MAG: ribosome biogenesis GTPase Der [Bacteroidetes bacterium GWF2_40_13]OFZ26866.1 MAG: ribosome biogenesis GTPase Der [Bacteroidetes bacterium RIFOXYC2_FULL_40_12
MANILAIVGRPNVGKSTLFNRLIEERKAIIDETAGVTRDRHYGKADWNGYDFSVIDTGGYVTNSDDIFESEIRKQVMLAIDEADVILFLTDVTSGITDLDLGIAEILRKSRKKVILATNKVDNHDRAYLASEFYSLGLGEVFTISSINGSGTGELLDEAIKYFTKKEEGEEEDELPKIAVVGRPNAGKSSLINALLDEERNIVTEIAGTTRDSINTRYNKFGYEFTIIDTAGLRKKSKVSEDLEFYSVMRAVRTIEESDVCLLMIDATRGVEAQDVNIFHLIEKNRKGVVVLINKWDLVEKDTHSVKQYTEMIKEKLAPFTDVPILFISALTKQRIFKSIETAMEVYKNRKQKIATSQLNQYLLEAIEDFPPPAIKGKYIKIKYVTQLPTNTPQFAFYCNLPQYVKEPYMRYLENKLRSAYSFTGVPIQIYMRQK